MTAKNFLRRFLSTVLTWAFVPGAVTQLHGKKFKKINAGIAVLGIAAQVLSCIDTSGACVSPPAGLVAWWQGENNTKDVLSGAEGLNTGVTFAPGTVGSCFDFSTAGANVRIPDAPSLRFTDALTVEVWVYPRSHDNYHEIVSKWNVAPNGGYSYDVALDPDGRAYMVLCGDGSGLFASVLSTNSMPLNQWTHVAATYDGQLIKIYINGTFQTQTAYDKGIFPGTLDLGIGAAVGGAAPGQSAYSFDGRIDEPSLYGRALTPDEIRAIFEAGSAGKCISPVSCVSAPAGLVAWWRAENNTKEFISGTEGQIFGDAAYATGTVGTAFDFGATGGHVRVPDSPALHLTSALSVEAWVYPRRQGVNQVIASKWTVDAGSGNFAYALALHADSRAYLALSADGGGIPTGSVFTTNVVPLNQWTHLVGTYDGSALRMYVNGNLQAVVAYAQGAFPGTLDFGIGGTVGGAAAGQADYTFDGRIDEVSLYSRGLAPIEVWSIFNAGSYGKCPPQSCVAPPSDMAAWWRGEGNTDEVLTGSHAQAYGGLSFKAGRVGLSFDFNGNSPHVRVPDSPSLHFTNALTIEAWVYPRSIGGNQDLVSKWDSRLEQNFSYALSLNATGQPYLVVCADGKGVATAVVTATNAIPLNEWTHLAATYDGSFLKVYLNGVLQTQLAYTEGVYPGIHDLGIGGTVGGVTPGEVAYPFDGQIDEPTLYARALDSTEIAAIFEAGSAGKCVPQPPCTPPATGLVSWWPGENNTRDIVTGLEAKPYGTVTFAPGTVGSAFDFAGGHLRIADNPTLRFTNALTVEAWVYPRIHGAYHELVSKWNVAPSGGYSYDLALHPDGRAYLVICSDGLETFASVLSTNSLPLGQWTHVAATYDGQALKIYINGAFQNQTAHDKGIFPGTLDLGIGGAVGGAAPGQAAYLFNGRIDEPTLYARALTADEIKAVFHAGASGKCVTGFPPFIIAQPVDTNATVGQDVTFTVVAGGSPLLLYQWFGKGEKLDGATNASLTLTKVPLSAAGLYYVAATNAAGFTLSRQATLSVSLPPALVRVMDTASPPAGGRVAIPVTIVANGNESALGFSLNFDASKLSFSEAVLGTGTVDGQLIVNPAQVGAGKLGLLIGQPSGTVLAPGTQEVAQVVFTTLPSSVGVETEISFGDQPTLRQLSDTNAVALPAVYAGGTLTYPASQFEADVAPRPDGDKVVSIIDWVQAGRYVARVDFPANDSEFQRADCAPRSTGGDGAITVNDWVQAGRYAAGLDPMQVAAGPTQEGGVFSMTPIRQDAQTHTLQVADALLLDAAENQVSVNLDAQGDESALSFSLFFNKDALVFVGADKGSGLGEATLNVNTEFISQGKVGFAAGLMNKTFGTGLRELVKVTFRAAAASGSYPVVLGDQPVPRGASDTNALGLAAEYLNGTVYVNPQPTLQIKQQVSNITLAWPNWATNYVLQEALEPVNSPISWTNVVTKPAVVNGEQVLTLPASGSTRFYRLQH